MRPGHAADTAVELAVAVAAVAGAAAAFGWMAVARAAAGGAPWFLPIGAAVVAVAAGLAARRRSDGVRIAAVGGFVVLLVLGEVLLYRHALDVRLLAMHAAEGTANPQLLAEEELRGMDAGRYLQIEVTLAWFTAVAGSLALVWRGLRPHEAVAAFAVTSGPASPGAASPAP